MRFLAFLAILGLAAAFPAVTPDQVKRTGSAYELDESDLEALATSRAIVDMSANPTVCIDGVNMIDGGVSTGNLCKGGKSLEERPERAGVAKFDSARFR